MPVLTTRIRNATTLMRRDADSLDNAAAHMTCATARDTTAMAATILRHHARVILGDIGEPEETEEIEIEPIEVPQPARTPVPA